MGTCVGPRNHRLFFVFLCYTSAHALLTTCFCLPVFLNDDLEPPYLSPSTIKGLTVVLGVYAGCIFATLFFFGFYHFYLASQNVTTNESLRSKFRGKRNPYDKGFSENIREFLCAPLPPSRVFDDPPPMEVIEKDKEPDEDESDEEDLFDWPKAREGSLKDL